MNKLAAYLFVTLVALGLASAQINFSTGWGKRSASHHPASDGAFITRHPSDEKYLSDEKLSDDADVNSGLDRCRSLVKSLGLISLIAQVSQRA